MRKLATPLLLCALGLTGCAGAPEPEVDAVESQEIAIPRVGHIVFFDHDSDALPDNAKDILSAHVRYLIQNPTQKILIEGAADETGDPDYNFALGLRRANVVKTFFLKEGVSRDLLLVRSVGENRPLNSSNQPGSLARNRRVTLVY